MIEIIQKVVRDWKPLFVTGLLFKLVAFIVLTPCVGILFRFFVKLSGRTVLADVDIASFLLHPVGWATMLVVGGAIVATFSLQLSMLSAVCIAGDSGSPAKPIAILPFVLVRFLDIWKLAIRIVLLLLCVSIPFLAVSGLVYALLLTKHDINFYLTNKPKELWIAGGLIGSLLLALAALWMRLLCSRFLALPIMLYESRSPRKSLCESMHRTQGARTKIALELVTWWLVSTLLNAVLTFLILGIAQRIVPAIDCPLWLLPCLIGTAISVVAFGNLLGNLIANAALAALLTQHYLRLDSTSPIRIPVTSHNAGLLSRFPLTKFRLAAGLMIAALLAALVGILSIQTLDDDRRIDVTAHRGGAAVAPENTLAAIRLAIQANADWVEIDVQESSDGVVMVAHDSDLKKVAGNPIKIWEGTASDLRAIDIGSYFSPDFASERVPTLAEVLEVCKDKVGVNIELKYYGHTDALEAKVVELVERYEMADQIVIMSLELDGLKKVKAMRPGWTCGLLTAVALGDLTKINVDFFAVNESLATSRFIRLAHEKQKLVAAWTINDVESLERMISRGVDNLITDTPALAREAASRREAMSPLEKVMTDLSWSLGIRPSGG